MPYFRFFFAFDFALLIALFYFAIITAAFAIASCRHAASPLRCHILFSKYCCHCAALQQRERRAIRRDARSASARYARTMRVTAMPDGFVSPLRCLTIFRYFFAFRLPIDAFAA
jgi:hypothetical protein